MLIGNYASESPRWPWPIVLTFRSWGYPLGQPATTQSTNSRMLDTTLHKIRPVVEPFRLSQRARHVSDSAAAPQM